MNKKQFPAVALLGASFLAASALHFFSGATWPYDLSILEIRASIYFEIICVAGIMGMGGLILQTLLHNPLAEPYVLGVSGGASLGAVLASWLGLTPLLFFRTAFSITGAVLVSSAVFAVSLRSAGFSLSRALLFGIAANSFFSALIMLFQSLLKPNDLQASILFLMGNIDALSLQENILLGAACLLPLIYLLVRGRELDIARSGEEMALAVGVDTGRLQALGFAAVSVSAGIAVSVCGMIGFVGLVAPALVRMLLRTTHRGLAAAVWVLSASVLLLAAVLARSIVPGTYLSAGVMTALIGAPVFIWVLLARGQGGHGV